MKEDKFNQLLSAIYETALTPDGWSGMGNVIAEGFEAQNSCILIFSGGMVTNAVTSTMPEDVTLRYQAYYGQLDPWLSMALCKDETPLVGQELVSDKQVLKSEFYQDFGKELGLFNVLGGVMDLQKTSLAMISIQRPRETSQYGNPEKQQLKMLMPHIQRALTISKRFQGLEQQVNLGFAGLETLHWGVAIVTGNGRILFANSAMERLAGQNAGFSLSLSGISAARPVEYQHLRRLVTAASQGQSAGSMVLTAATGQKRVALTVSPFPRKFQEDSAWPQGVAMILAKDLIDSSRVGKGLMTSLYGLTEAEVNIVLALIKGQSPAEIAESRSVSLATVRTQLKQIQSKVGVSSLRDLIGTLGRFDDLP